MVLRDSVQSDSTYQLRDFSNYPLEFIPYLRENTFFKDKKAKIDSRLSV